ncbi:MAG: hypothetical protein QXX30_01610 [Candidatus Aenigmatarchaeota archaeon]
MVEENNLKIKILELEKRLVELEMAISSIKEKLKDMENINVREILDKVEELEDLFLIESASLTELKNLLETELTGELESKIENYKNLNEEKISEIGNKISEIMQNIEGLQKVKEDYLNEKQKIGNLNEEIENIKKLLEEMKKKIEDISLSFSVVSQEVNEKLEKLDETKKKMEEELNKRLPESFLTDFVKLENEVALMKVNFSSISKEVERIFSDVQLLKPDVIKEVLARVIEIKGEIENKMQETISLISSISGSKEKIKEIPIIEAKVEEIYKDLNKIKSNIELISTQLSLFSSKNDLEEIKKVVENLSSNLENIKKNVIEKEKFEYLEKDLIDIKKRLDNSEKEINKVTVDINGLMKALSNLDNKIYEISKVKEGFDLKNYVRVEDFSNLVADVKKSLTEIEKIKKDSLNYLTKEEVDSFKRELEDIKRILDEIKTKLIPENIIQNITNKISFLEAKIKQLEELSKEKIRPIILE